jgi:hypothetical protein
MQIFVNLNRLVTPRALRNILLLPVILVSLLMTACSNSSSDAAAINAEFSALGIKGTISGQNINLDLSSLGNCATNIENMVIGVNAYGASISPDPRIARDYSKPVDFTLTAPDGTKAVYTVTVKGADCISAPAPAPTPTPTPTPTACTAAPIGSTGYSLVFKGCDANNVATYYDKTECVRVKPMTVVYATKIIHTQTTTTQNLSKSQETDCANLRKRKLTLQATPLDLHKPSTLRIYVDLQIGVCLPNLSCRA